MTEDSYTIAEATLAADDFADFTPSTARLIVYYGHGLDVRTRIVELPDGCEVGFGRSRSEMVHIDSEKVSRKHARLRHRDGRVTILDLGSRNGTRINGERITEETQLSSGDEISIGPATAILSLTTQVARRAALGSDSYFEERLAAEADRGQRYQRTFGLAMIRLEGNDGSVDQAIEQIASQLRPMDVLAEYGPDELALLLPELDAESTADAANRLAARARTEDGSMVVRVGVAVFPSHGVQPGELLTRAREALRSARVDQRDVVATPPQEAAPTGEDIIVNDPQMRRLFSLVRKVADTSMTVLINGETGAGKEVIAEELHRSSGRHKQRFLRVNCASIAETLLESELFGHERGAFTSADRRKKGYFEAADGGTLFLDEIGEISSGLQAKLLRVLEERKFTRVGGTEEIEVDVRVVCATNRDLESEVQRGAFREDLFFRVSAFTLVVPPLRDRSNDILPLAEMFVRHAAAGLKVAPPVLLPAAAKVIARYAWPGNVRELRNAMERAVVLQSCGAIDVEQLPDRVREESAAPEAGSSNVAHDVRDQVAELERRAIVAALEKNDSNQTRAARQLGLSRRALIYKMEKYGLKKPPRSS